MSKDQEFQDSIENYIMILFKVQMREETRLGAIFEGVCLREDPFSSLGYTWYCKEDNEMIVNVTILWNSSTEVPRISSVVNFRNYEAEKEIASWIESVLDTQFRQLLRRYYSRFEILPVQDLDKIIIDYLF